MTSQEGSVSSTHTEREGERKSPLVSFRQPRGDWSCIGTFIGRPAGVSDLSYTNRVEGEREKRGGIYCLPFISSTDMNHRNPWLTSSVLSVVDDECVEWWWQHVCHPACCGSGPVRLQLNTSAGLYVVFCGEQIFPVNPDIAHLI